MPYLWTWFFYIQPTLFIFSQYSCLLTSCTLPFEVSDTTIREVKLLPRHWSNYDYPHFRMTCMGVRKQQTQVAHLTVHLVNHWATAAELQQKMHLHNEHVTRGTQFSGLQMCSKNDNGIAQDKYSNRHKFRKKLLDNFIQILTLWHIWIVQSVTLTNGSWNNSCSKSWSKKFIFKKIIK